MNLLSPFNNQVEPTPWAFAAIQHVLYLAAQQREQVQVTGTRTAPPDTAASSDSRTSVGYIPQRSEHTLKGWTS